MKKNSNSDHSEFSDNGNKLDIGLITRFKKTGNTHNIYRLMDKYSAHIIAFSMTHLKNQEDVKDFTNDIFIKLCDKLKNEDIINFKSWLYVFMKNMFYDLKRRQQLHRKFLNRQEPSDWYSIEQELFHDIDKKQLYDSMEMLSDHERKCLNLLYMEGKNYNEVIEETGWTFNQVRGIRDRATKKLRDNLSLEFKKFNQ